MAKWDNLIILNRIFLHPKHSHYIRKVQRRVCDSHSCRSQWANMLHWDISLLFKQHLVWFPWNELSSKTKWTRLSWSPGKVKLRNAAHSWETPGSPADLGWGLEPAKSEISSQKQLKWLLVQLERQGDGLTSWLQALCLSMPAWCVRQTQKRSRREGYPFSGVSLGPCPLSGSSHLLPLFLFSQFQSPWFCTSVSASFRGRGALFFTVNASP